MMFRWLTFVIFTLVFHGVAIANPIVGLFNPLFKAHSKFLSNQWAQASPLLEKRLKTKDSLNPVVYYDLSFIYKQSDIKKSLQFANQSVIYFAKDSIFRNSKIGNQNAKRYKLIGNDFRKNYQDLIVEYYTKHRKSNPSKENSINDAIRIIALNKEISNWYSAEIGSFSQVDSKLNCAIQGPINTLQSVVELIDNTNDTVQYLGILYSGDILQFQDYLKPYLESINHNPESLFTATELNFFKKIEDTLYNLEFERAIILNSEESYIRYYQSYPKSPLKDSAFKLAENIAYLNAKKQNSTEGYNEYLKKYPTAAHHKQIEYLLRYLKIIPVPYLTKDGKYVYVDSISTETWTDSTYDFAFPYASKYHSKWFSNGATLIPGCALVMKNDDFGSSEFFYVEKDGSRVLKTTYDEIIQFTRDLAFIQKSDRYGIINSNGQEIIPCKFQKIYFDTVSKIGVINNGKAWAIFNQAGKLITPFQYDNILSDDQTLLTSLPVDVLEISHQFLAAQFKGKWGYINEYGNPAIPFKYSAARPFNNSFALIKLDELGSNSWTLIHKSGRILKESYSSINLISGNYYSTISEKEGKKRFCILKTPVLKMIETNDSFLNSPILGSELLCSQEEILISYSIKNRFFGIHNKAGWTIFDSAGIAAIKSPVNNLRLLSKKLFVSKDKKLDRWFNPVSKSFTTSQFESIDYLSENLVLTKVKGAISIYLINEVPFKIITSNPESYKDIRNVVPAADKEGYFLISKGDFWGLIDENGKEILSPKYLDISFTSNKDLFIVEVPEKDNPEESNFGVYNVSGKFAIEPLFDSIGDEEFTGYWLVPYNEKLAWLDAKGNLFAE